jgi:feruloyl esterase
MIVLTAAAMALGAHAAYAEPRACSTLTALARPDLLITAVQHVAAGSLPHDNPARAALTGEARSRMGMPAHCLVTGVVHPRTGLNGQAFGDGFELRLPDDWNGKFLFQGGGGMDGVVGEALGAITTAGATAPPALLRGYAVVSTDSGHRGSDAAPGGAGADASFALDQQARIDYFYASIGDVSEAARALIAARYGRAPEHAYFMGCSNGGRSAMIAAQRFPLLFDGIVAGSPAFRVSQAAMALQWDTLSLMQAAPAGQDGKPVLARAFSDADLHLVGKGVLAACDAADGLVDGSIDAPSQCHFSPESLLCNGEKKDSCLSNVQVKALTQAIDGPRDSAGHVIYPGWFYDAGIATAGWRAWTLGTSATSVPNARNTTLVASSITRLFFTPPAPDFDPMTFDFDTDPARIQASRALNDADSTFYQSFTAHGGRMVMYHGYSDPVFSAKDLIAYYQRLAAGNGGMDKVRDWARLFMVPGMTHCGGGPSLDDFDPLAALEAWVEKGEPPDRIVAEGTAFPGRSRPLCAYPQETRYTGKGDSNDAANFICQ